MVSAAPGSPAFLQGLDRAAAHAQASDQVYLYCIDSAVEGLGNPQVAILKTAGVHLYACAYSLQRRGIVASSDATLSGLTMLSDILASTDEFHSFN